MFKPTERELFGYPTAITMIVGLYRFAGSTEFA